MSIQSGTGRRSHCSDCKHRRFWKPSLHVHPPQKETRLATLSLPPSHSSCRLRHHIPGCRVLAVQLTRVEQLLLRSLLSPPSAKIAHPTISGKNVRMMARTLDYLSPNSENQGQIIIVLETYYISISIGQMLASPTIVCHMLSQLLLDEP